MPPQYKLKKLREKTPEILVEDVPDRLFLSKNDKTGVSINTSIALTCTGMTRACSVYCYGLGGRIAMPAALQRQAENAALFGIDTQEWGQLADEAMDIAHVVSRQQDFLRMFGVGDLQLGSVYFINQLAAYAKAVKPKFRIWVSTRKFDMAAKLVESPNLHVMLSFDATTLARHRAAGLKLLAKRRPQFFAAWVRCSEDETVPKWVNVVFEEHAIGRGRAKRPPERRACPATIHESYPESTELESACSNCQYCFDAKRRSTGSPLIQLKGKK
jgi:hypothetical protein